MVPKFANVYTFRNKKNGLVFVSRWDVADGGQTNYTGPSSEYEFVGAELNVPDGERSLAEASELGAGVATLPTFLTGLRLTITPIQ